MTVARYPALMLRFRLLGLVCLILLLGQSGTPPVVLAAAGPAPAVFLSNLDDIPLMPGLAERKDLAISFDKPEGRIVEAYAEGQLAAEAVTKFYAATLPQLGWRNEGGNRFTRESEELQLSVNAISKGLTVRFALSPRP